MHEFAETPYTVRAHNLYTSGPGRGLPHWSSGNVYHEDADGLPRYDWSVADPVFDAWVSNGFRPIVELGFCPKVLVPSGASFPFTPMPSLYGVYESGLWAWPPRDLQRRHDLVSAMVRHYLDRYGPAMVGTWYWEVWNEPDISYWQGTTAQLDAIRSRSGLEVCEPDRRLEPAPADLTMRFVVPLPGVSLLELEAQ